MGRWIGIDLGTTNSAGAAITGSGPEILFNREAAPLTPSVVSLREKRSLDGAARSELLVGQPAYDYWPLAPSKTIVSVKRLMGRGMSDPEVERVCRWAQYPIVEPSDGTRESLRVVLGGREYSPTDISAEILQKIKQDAEFRLGEEVTHAVVTVPAYFSQIQKNATRQACLQAGMKVIQILPEPTAAAVAFGIDRSDDAAPTTVLIFDLGGGTFDVCVLMLSGGVFAQLNLQGDMWLGGDDFDELIFQQVVRYVENEHVRLDRVPDDRRARFVVELRRAARRAKEQLTAANAADVMIPGILVDESGNLVDVEVEVTREWFEDVSKPLLERIAGIVRRAVTEADLEPEDVDYVLMAGSASALPVVQRAMDETFGRDKVLRNVHPKHCVALGAAIVAARTGGMVCQAVDRERGEECGTLNDHGAAVCARCGNTLDVESGGGGAVGDDVVLVDIAATNYGVQSAGDVFTVFVEKSEPCPPETPRAHDFYTRFADQRMISVPVFGGPDLDRASANEKQGEAFAILPPGLPSGTPIRIRMWLDRNGNFQLTAHLEDGTDLSPLSVPKGEALDRTIQALHRLEEAIAESGLPPRRAQRVQKEREQVFEDIRRGHQAQAMRKAEEIADSVEKEAAAPADASMQADNVVGFAQFVLKEYGWMLSAAEMTALEQGIAELERAKRFEDEEALRSGAERLGQQIDALPDVVRFLAGMRMAMWQIRSADPATALRFEHELEDIVEQIRAGRPEALPRLDDLATRLAAAMAEREELVADRRCSRDHAVPKGHICPVCGENIMTLDAKQATSTGTFPTITRGG